MLYSSPEEGRYYVYNEAKPKAKSKTSKAKAKGKGKKMNKAAARVEEVEEDGAGADNRAHDVVVVDDHAEDEVLPGASGEQVDVDHEEHKPRKAAAKSKKKTAHKGENKKGSHATTEEEHVAPDE